MNFFICMMLMLISFDSFSYDGSRCKEKLYLPTTRRMGSGPSTWLTISSIAPTSTSQFVSSTGSCSATAEMNLKKKEYIAHNLEPLKIDSSKGNGEYLLAYSALLGCEEKAEEQLLFLFQKNFIEIYGEDIDKKPEEVYNSLEIIMRSNLIVSAGCKLKT